MKFSTVLVVGPWTFLLGIHVHAQIADTIYHGGDIVTVDDKNPSAEALAVTSGRLACLRTFP